MIDYDQGLKPGSRLLFHNLGVATHGLRSSLLAHPVYQRIDDLASLRVFMTSHVFAVWDFMSLLKSLQRSITCIEQPWTPPKDRICSRLINEINLEEECDEVAPGRYTSHYELYLDAMTEVGADRGPIETLVAAAARGEPLEPVMARLPVPATTVAFTRCTLAMAALPAHQVAAAFLLGREAVIPPMFRRILGEVNERGDRWSRVMGVVRRRLRPADKYQNLRLYLDRHIDLDSGTHTPMGERLLMHLCGTDEQKWSEAAAAARRAIEARRSLWDGVIAAVERDRKTAAA